MVVASFLVQIHDKTPVLNVDSLPGIESWTLSSNPKGTVAVFPGGRTLVNYPANNQTWKTDE